MDNSCTCPRSAWAQQQEKERRPPALAAKHTGRLSAADAVLWVSPKMRIRLPRSASLIWVRSPHRNVALGSLFTRTDSSRDLVPQLSGKNSLEC
jgi:hypothetical protein